MGDAIYKGTHDFTGATVTGVSGSPRTFDAIVAASGGDYTTLQAAITGGATSIFLKDGTYTAVANITLPNYCTIIGESWNAIINMAGYTLTLGTYNTLRDFKITTSSNANLIIVKTSNYLENLFIECTRNTNPGAQIGYITDNNVSAYRVHLINIQFDIVPVSGVNLSNKTAVWMQNTNSDQHYIVGVEFNGAATSQCRQLFHAGNSVQVTNCSFNNCGTAAGATIVSITGGDISFSNTVFNANTSGAVSFTGVRCSVDNLVIGNSTLQMNIQGDGSVVSNVSAVGKLAISADHVKVTGCVFEAGITIGGDNNTISATTGGAIAAGGANTITISSGTTNCVTSCHTDAAISDSGTSTVLANNTVY
jgi:hypothetical protein